ncbi:MAG: hypothetical protein ACRCYO_12260 [Bacteroidia bacterium]
MIRILYTTLVILACFVSQNVSAQAPVQDSVFLMSGKVLTGIVKDTAEERLRILIPKKDGNFKADFVDQELVFSVKYKNGQESIFYKQDTLFGNYFTPQEVRYFLQGERDARAKFRTPYMVAGAFALGFGMGTTQHFLMFVPPFAYSAISVGFRIKIRPGTVSNPDYLRYDTYLLGYEKEARKRRLFRTLAAGGIGLVAGFATQSIINGSN